MSTATKASAAQGLPSLASTATKVSAADQLTEVSLMSTATKPESSHLSAGSLDVDQVYEEFSQPWVTWRALPRLCLICTKFEFQTTFFFWAVCDKNALPLSRQHEVGVSALHGVSRGYEDTSLSHHVHRHGSL